MTLAAIQVETAIDELRALLGDRLSTSSGVRDHHSKDESWHIPHRPDAVVFPTTNEEVSAIVQICTRHRVPVVALFGPTDPNQWCPWGTAVEVIRSPRTVKSLGQRLHEASFPATVAGLRWPTGIADVHDIAVDDVIAAIERLLPVRNRAAG